VSREVELKLTEAM